MAQKEALKIRFLGEMQIERNGRRVSLPQSKKTRALLAYLVLNNKPQRREKLCSLLWDVTDDPRGALRWSLSRLRPLVDSNQQHRIVAEREHVQFDRGGAWIDVVAARERFDCLTNNHDQSLKELKDLAGIFRGEFLEGLELPDFDEYQAWCVAEREQWRRVHSQILSRILEHVPDAGEALPYARTLIQIDPLNESAHARLLRLLSSEGRSREAEQHHEAALRIFREAGVSASSLTNRSWQTTTTVSDGDPSNPQLDSGAFVIKGGTPSRIVGREKELAHLQELLSETVRTRRESVVMLGGEPGIGKTRLLSELIRMAQQQGATLIEGRAFEAESSRPYGPWIDALGKIPKITVGSTIGADLAALIPQLAAEADTSYTREKMFGAVVELIAARAHSSGLVVLSMDDVQWFDDASAELLHYVVRSNRHRPVIVVLAARAGELPDNTPMLRVLRGIRRDTPVEEVLLQPLNLEQMKALVAQIHPSLAEIDGLADTSGNPLFALELARSRLERKGTLLSPTLVELVRDRFERLRAPTPDVLRWGAILGSTFTAETVSQLSGIDSDAMIQSLERLERHGLIHASAAAHSQSSYGFSHDLVRHVVYTGISEPRRRIMHSRAAAYLSSLQQRNDSLAADVVNHAALAGDAALAAASCVAAGRQCLRLFANVQAEHFAKRGLRFAEQLQEPERIKLMIELTQIGVAARRPKELQERAHEIEQLGERALDYGCMLHARLAFHTSAYLRWEGGDWSIAERDTLKAELVSRTANAHERIIALAEAARCLVILERDIGRASALMIEASRLAEHAGEEALSIAMAEALIHEHEGRYHHAIRFFSQAFELAQRDRDRENEFMALERLVVLHINRKEFDEALPLATQLVGMGEKLREGSEAPFARVLRTLSMYSRDSALMNEMEAALEDLQSYDAKHRLAFSLTRTAEIDFEQGRLELAETRAAKALALAETLKLPSEIALATTLLGQTAMAREELVVARDHAERLKRVAASGLSRRARDVVDAFIGKIDLGRDDTSYGTSNRRKNLRTTS